MGNKSGSFAGDANGNLPGGSPKSPRDGGESHSDDPVLSAQGIGSGPETTSLEKRTHTDDGYEQVTPGHTYNA